MKLNIKKIAECIGSAAVIAITFLDSYAQFKKVQRKQKKAKKKKEVRKKYGEINF